MSLGKWLGEGEREEEKEEGEGRGREEEREGGEGERRRGRILIALCLLPACSGEVKMYHQRRPYTICVTTFQMATLLAFNQSDMHTYR